ncbi:alternate-type signal peptide domain-containing protein [Rhodococcus sp. R1101]|uniref:alternate-type signal peptide domain-containing protein n=1 Tax=Rhodococcus sp. R1101 TaxID=1170698 RepID=UPI00031BF7E8|nr:alternate-type signal peptide domain-containing protein [Rhodococcus sp. R1101]
MKKQTKGAIAAGAGAILLLGGLGSLAFWNDQTDGDAGTITSGQLTLGECAGGGTWTDVGNGGATISDISSFRIVPGDTVRYTCASTLTAQGDNLEATLTANLDGVTGNTDLRNALITTIDGEYAGQSFTGGADGVQVVANGGAPQDISVDITITFDPATSGTTGQNETVDLGNLSLNLQQNTNPAPA